MMPSSHDPLSSSRGAGVREYVVIRTLDIKDF